MVYRFEVEVVHKVEEVLEKWMGEGWGKAQIDFTYSYVKSMTSRRPSNSNIRVLENQLEL